MLGVGATIWLVLDWSAPVAALVAGSLGAVVSVIQRINQGTFSLEYDSGRLYAMFLGGLRPLIGGAFALVLSFAFTGGLLNLPIAADEPDAHRKARVDRRRVRGGLQRALGAGHPGRGDAERQVRVLEPDEPSEPAERRVRRGQ